MVRKEVLTCVGVAVFATILVVVWGPGDAANPDSATYIDGARHLARGDGYVTCRTGIESDGPGPIRAWPPGFSALMVPGIWLGLSVLQSARVVLALSFVAASVLVFLLARVVSGPRPAFLPLLAVAAFALQPSQLYVVNRVLSDVPFVPAALSCVYLALILARRREPGLALKVGLGAALVGMVLVRNAGLLMAAGILVGLFLSSRASSFRERARALFPVLVTFGLLFAPWMLRNQLVSDTALGRVGLKATEPFAHAVLAATGLAAWVTDATAVFRNVRGLVGVYVGGVVAFGLVIAGLALRHRWWKSRSVILIGSASAVYLVLMIATATLHPFNELDEARFWVVSWPLGSLFVLGLVRRMRVRLAWLHHAGVGGLSLTVALYAVSFVRALPGAEQAGGLLEREVKALAKLVPSRDRCRLLMNDARPALVHRELGPTSFLPESRAAFEAALKAHPRLCLAVVGKDEWADAPRRPRRGAKRSARGVSLVQSLVQSKRLRLLAERPNLRVYEAVR